MKYSELDDSADEAAALLKSLAHPVRLRILCQLVDGERSVGDLAGAMGVRDTLVSQHLALLRREGHVTNRRDGQTIYYSLAGDTASEVVQLLYRLYCSTGRKRH